VFDERDSGIHADIKTGTHRYRRLRPRPGICGIGATGYSFVAFLGTGRTSWTTVLDEVRLGPTDDATAVTVDLGLRA
jgi:hypothetical protein